MEIAKKAVKGVFWISLTTLVAKSLRFATTLVLAKLLLPSDFGLLAIGLLAINSIIIFRDLGLGHALIQRQKDIEEASNTAFIMNQISAFILVISINLLAPFVANFFRNPVISPIIRILSLTILVDALATVPSFLLEKQLDFRKKFLPEAISTFAYCATAITLAFLKFGVWSIVYAQIISAIILTCAIWKVSRWKLHLSFNRSLAFELLSFGKYVMAMNLLMFAITSIDHAIIGRMFDAKNLGFYTFAMMIANLPAINISHLVGKVTFPVYSKIQQDKELLTKTYFKTFKYTSLFVIPVSFGMVIFAPDLIRVFYADKWLPAILPLQILIFFGLFRALSTISGNVLMSVGAVRWITILDILELTMIASLIYPVARNYGILGVSTLMTLTITFGGITLAIMANKFISVSLKYYLKIIVPYSLISLISGVGAFFLSKSIFGELSLLSTILAIVLTGTCYLFIVPLFDKEIKRFFINIKRKFFPS